MKFGRHLIQKLVDISKVSNESIYTTLNNIGLEVEQITSFCVPSGVVIGKVLERVKHQNADKLSICAVDIGKEVLQIVCGAKNVQKGQFVPVAKVGTKLAHIEIQKSVIRGVESRGMICSSTEIGLPKLEDGIFVLDDSIGELVLGKELCEYSIFNDSIFEISITPNRGDCLCLMGIAMDLSVALNLQLKTLKEKEKRNEIAPGIGRILNIHFDNSLTSSLCYKVAKLKDLTNDAELRLSLALNDALSGDSLHNIIKFSTYITGVIIKAYPFDRFAHSEEKIVLDIKKDAQNMEGVFFGSEQLSQIGLGDTIIADENTQLAVFEASFIQPSVISAMIFENGIKSDCHTSYLSKRGSSPDLEGGISFLTSLISRMSDSTIYSSTQKVLQDYPQRRINFKFDDIAAIIGNAVRSDEVASILKRMNFMINSAADDSYISTIPSRTRHDINSVQDIAEEILRIKGIDTIESKPQILPQCANINDDYRFYKFSRDIAKKALSQGFFEALHYVFYERERLSAYNLPVLAQDLDLLNPITNELNTLRTSLIPALLDSIKRNENYGFEKVALFELGSVYDSRRAESRSLAFAVNGLEIAPKYPAPKGKEWDFYSFAARVSDILGGFELENTGSASDLYHGGIVANILKNGVQVGVIGKLNPRIAQSVELKNCFICEINMELLFGARGAVKFREFSKYQDIKREFSILVDKNVSFGAIKEAILNEKIPHLVEITPLDLYESADFGEMVSISFRATFQSMDSTLKAQDLDDSRIIELLNERFGAHIR